MAPANAQRPETSSAEATGGAALLRETADSERTEQNQHLMCLKPIRENEMRVFKENDGWTISGEIV